MLVEPQIDLLTVARAAHERRDWRASYEAFDRAGVYAPLRIDDLDAFSFAAWRLGHVKEASRAAERVFAELTRTDPTAAAMKATELGLAWLVRGDLNIGQGWMNRARRLLAGAEEGPAHGYLAYLDANVAAMTLDLDAYLKRIGHAGPVRADLETLNALHEAHVNAVPFENLDVHAGRPVMFSLEAAFDEIVTRRRGGWCYEMNAVFGWALGENMMSGSIVVEGPSGSLTGAALRGGDLVIKGNVGARTGIDQKGGTIITMGSAGISTGFMMQRGHQIICGDTNDGLGDSMYDGFIYVGGKIASLGVDCVPAEMTDEDHEFINRKFAIYDLGTPPDFNKFECGKVLHNYDALEPSERKLVL